MGNVIQRWITSVIFQQAPTSVIMRAREKTTVVLLRAWEYPKTGFKLHRNRRCENDRTACWMWRPGLSLLDAEARALPAGCEGQGSPCWMRRPGLSLLDVEARALPASSVLLLSARGEGDSNFSSNCRRKPSFSPHVKGSACHRLKSRHRDFRDTLHGSFMSLTCKQSTL